MKNLNENVNCGMDLGSALFLENYEKERQRDVYPKIMFIHFLNSLYTNRNSFIQTPTVLLRSLGLTLTNRLTFLKNFYIDGAMK
jgi:2-polyprenyl-6-methoxyphenol hydroxylase-like FAD-dependent oxidoreductase